MSRRLRSSIAAISFTLLAAPAVAVALPPPPSPIFIETWESAADATTRWAVHTANSDNPDTGGIDVVGGEAVPCSTNYQHETIRASSGRAFTATPTNGANIALTGGSAYCVTAWIRGSTSPAAAPFILIADETSATSAATVATNLIIGPTTPSGAGQPHRRRQRAVAVVLRQLHVRRQHLGHRLHQPRRRALVRSERRRLQRRLRRHRHLGR